MDQLGGVRVLIDRLGLPPRLRHLVTRIEGELGPLDQVGNTPGANEMRRILGMVDGQNLCAAIVAMLCNQIPAEEIEDEIKADARASDTRSLHSRWLEAQEAAPDVLVLLRHPSEDAFIAFDGPAERLADTLEEHHIILDGKTAIALTDSMKPKWIRKLIDARLDVSLAYPSEDEPGQFDWYPVDEVEADDEPATIDEQDS